VPGSGPLVAAELGFVVSFVVLGLIPMMLTRPVYGRPPKDVGLGLGDLRWSGVLLAIGLPLAIAGGYVGAGADPIALVYPLGTVTRSLGSFVPYAFLYLLYYIGFEFYFRGFLLLGLAERLGPLAAVLFQAGLATLVHAGKPGLEFVAAFPASLLFGWAVLRTRSIWPIVVIHWVVGAWMDWLLLGP
jgi:membrane protease YdiL (CAAX protease family)